MKIIKAIIWDFDGTMLDSTHEGMENMIFIAKLLKFNLPTIKIFQKHWGALFFNFLDKVAEDCGWPEGARNLFLDKSRENRHLWKKHKFFPGTKLVLEKLEDRGIKLGIISTRVKESAEKDIFSMMDYFEISDINPKMFFIIQGSKDCSCLKPDPKVFDLALARLEEQNISPNEVVYVGDTANYDLKATLVHKPKLSFIGMVSGACSRKTFLQEGVPRECIINALEQIFGAIEHIQNM